MPQYPDYPKDPNAFQLLGEGLYKGGGLLGEYDERQRKMREAIAEMAQKRAEAILRARAAEDQHRESEQKYNAAEAEKDRRSKFQERVAGTISKTLEKDPSLMRSSKPDYEYDPKEEEIKRLELDDGIGEQSVSGDPTWGMLNKATDEYIMGQGVPKAEPLDDEGMMKYGAQTGSLDLVKEYGDAERALQGKYDQFNDPELLKDFAIKAQQPGFMALARGYATNPAQYGPALQQWAAQNGYTGQKWWNAELGKMVRQAPQREALPPPLNPQVARQQKFTQEQTLKNDYETGTKKFKEGFTAFSKAQQALQRNNPADAYSAVINFVRTLDPASTVREAEEKLARMSASGGILSQWFEAIRRGLVGTMSDEVRRNLYESSQGLLRAEYEANYQPTRFDVRSQTLNYPDPTGVGASLDTLNTIGRGLGPQYEKAMGVDIFKPPAAPGPAAPPRPASIPARGNRKELTQEIAAQYLKAAKGDHKIATPEDRKKAMKALARDGYNVEGGTTR